MTAGDTPQTDKNRTRSAASPKPSRIWCASSVRIVVARKTVDGVFAVTRCANGTKQIATTRRYRRCGVGCRGGGGEKYEKKKIEKIIFVALNNITIIHRSRMRAKRSVVYFFDFFFLYFSHALECTRFGRLVRTIICTLRTIPRRSSASWRGVAPEIRRVRPRIYNASANRRGIFFFLYAVALS